MKKIIENFGCMAVSYSIISLWLIAYTADRLFLLFPVLSGKGILIVGQEYYRLLTGFLLHGNILHLALNATAMFWIGYFLEKKLGSKRFLLFTVLALPISQIVFFSVFPRIDNVFGGSILTFAYIGLIVAMRLAKPDFPRLKFGTWCGNWIMIYAVVGNIPIFSFMNLSTVALHGIVSLVGFVIGTVLCRCRYIAG